MYTHEAAVLFDVLTNYDCENYEHIANRTGWDPTKVNNVLAYVRLPSTVRQLGWTVPHVARGPGSHLYQAVLVNGNADLTDAEIEHVKNGAHCTLTTVASMGEKEAEALRICARYTQPPRVARRIRQVATALDGAAAMARIAADQMT